MLRSDRGTATTQNREAAATRNGVTGAKRGRVTVAELLANGEIDEQQATERAREAALRTLDQSAKSRAELKASLGRRGYPVHIVEPLLDRFESVGLLDDGAYAGAIVRAKAEVRGMSRRAIAADLARRGISGEIAEESLSQIDEEAQHAVLAQFVGKVLARSGGLDRNTRLRRAVAAVQRKGYEPEQAYAAVLAGLAVECFPGEEVP